MAKRMAPKVGSLENVLCLGEEAYFCIDVDLIMNNFIVFRNSKNLPQSSVGFGTIEW